MDTSHEAEIPPSADSCDEPLSTEDAQLVAEIQDEMQNRLPLACPVSYHGPGDEALLQQAMVAYQVQAILMRRRHPWMNFDALDSIVFNADYQQALRDISARAGRACEATSEPMGIGLAMTVKIGAKSAVVLDAGIAHGMVADDEFKRYLSLDTALHELCHVYDNARKDRLLAEDLKRGTVLPMQGHVFTAADACWSEYFANKYSNSGCSSPDSHPKFLAEVVPALVADVRAAIIDYRSNDKIQELLVLCQKKVKFLFQCFGYAAGRLSANGATLEAIALESVSALQQAGLYQIWIAVAAALDQLDARREDWTSFNDLQPLMDEADTTFRVLGLRYKLNDDGSVGVDIPFTHATMPNTPYAQLLATLATGKPA